MEKSELYNKQGKVEDPEIAREMADAEKPYRERKRMLGFMGPGKDEIEKGKNMAERSGRILLEKKNRKSQSEKVSREVSNFQFLEKGNGVRFEVAGHLLEIEGSVYPNMAHPGMTPDNIAYFHPISGTIDGNELNFSHLHAISEKFDSYIAEKWLEKGETTRKEEMATEEKMYRKNKESVEEVLK